MAETITLQAGDLVKYSVYPFTNENDGSVYFSAIVAFNEDEERLILQTYIENEVRQFKEAGMSTFCEIEAAHEIILKARIIF